MRFYLFTVFSFLLIFPVMAKSQEEINIYSTQYLDLDWEKELKLNPLQKEKVRKINKETEEQMNVLQMQLETIQYEMLDLTEKQQQQIREILDGKQKVKFDKILIKYSKEHHID